MAGIGISTVVAAGQRATQETALDTALQASTDMLNSATMVETDALMEQLAQEGDIVLDFLPEEDDLPLKDGEALYDAEWDFSDEDAPAVDGADADLPEEKGLFTSDSFYRIRVVYGEDGRARCIPPENDWGGARGITRRGETALGKNASRMEALSAVAEWLHEKFRAKLGDGPGGFQDGWVPRPQKEFLDWHGSKYGDSLDKGSFNKFIRNVRLSWREGSIPLHGAVFNAR